MEIIIMLFLFLIILPDIVKYSVNKEWLDCKTKNICYVIIIYPGKIKHYNRLQGIF